MPATLNGPAPTPAATAWDTDLFVLRGDDRGHLAARARTLAGFVETSDAPLCDLAATLAADAAPGGVRLAVVSGSAADLRAKLTRAADRIADPGCAQIRDAAGVYFFAEPLYPAGSVALLFPGEGAQYPGMLADLCGPFPEVEEAFAWCDRLAADAGRPHESLRRILHPTPENRAAAEVELRKLGPSIFGVLLADLAVYRVLQNLRVPAAAVAGHSAGELAALMSAGAMGGDLGPAPLLGLMDLMQTQEDAGGAADFALLAVGAGRDAVARVAGPGVAVAMDNCPRQCVAVGPTSQVAALESALAAQGVLCERLPFGRPYHTPRFEPWMGPFRAFFAGVPFAPPHTPVYSCSTGQRFPDNPAAARELAVNHWVRPVEFVRLVERMHADGVRLFVEAGPRGNLSAFVEDTLRGKPFAAVPANLPRRSGPTQVNHLAAILTAHGVPLDLGHLFARRSVGGVAWEPRPTNRLAALDGYFAVMEQFLDVQRDVMVAYLAGPGTPAEVAEPTRLPFLGEVVRHEPGREVVVRRPLDADEDLYADHHTLGGREVSRVDPGQNGLPVVPMTVSLEAMAEAAALLVPGKVVVALRNVRLFRWLPFDPDPTTMEVRAAVRGSIDESGTVEVTADVRDLGNSFLPDGAGKVACEAVVVLADRYPDPPAPRPFALTGAAACRSSVDDLRRNMFHGSLFQMIRSLDRVGPEGIDGTLEVQPRDGWLRSDPDPRPLLDPILTDAAMHLVGGWHLEQPDWSGRILLPVGVEAVEYFGPPPAPGTRMAVRVHNELETARQVKHGLELFDPAGRPWLRLTGAAYWRFYLPFGHVNFFGPKDEYYLSRDWPDAGGACRSLTPPADLAQPVLRMAGVRVTMTPRELAEYRTVPADRQSEWFFTRLVAKDAARAAWAAVHGSRIYPADIESDVVDGKIAVRHRGSDTASPLPSVAVAGLNGTVAAFADFAKRVGVGLAAAPKGTRPDAAARADAARRAVADATGANPDSLTATPLADGAFAVTGYTEVPPRVRVRTARRDGLIVATTTCEPA